VTTPAIRPATLADTEGIGLAHVRSWQSAYRGKMPQDYLDGLDPAVRTETWRRVMAETEPSRGGVLAAVADGGGITGFASFGPSRDHDTDPRQTGEVFAIYVDPDAWGTGTGRELMAGATAELARLGYTDAILWVLDTNDRARRFYALAGWAEDGATKTDASRGFDITEVRYRTMLSRTSARAAPPTPRSPRRPTLIGCPGHRRQAEWPRADCGGSRAVRQRRVRLPA
jgi:ribosomal protein S18 acetylase RimI-like enzyme